MVIGDVVEDSDEAEAQDEEEYGWEDGDDHNDHNNDDGSGGAGGSNNRNGSSHSAAVTDEPE